MKKVIWADMEDMGTGSETETEIHVASGLCPAGPENGQDAAAGQKQAFMGLHFEDNGMEVGKEKKEKAPPRGFGNC